MSFIFVLRLVSWDRTRLKFKQLIGIATEDDVRRWEDIKATFVRIQRIKSLGGNNQVGQVLTGMENISGGLEGIKVVLSQFPSKYNFKLTFCLK